MKTKYLLTIAIVLLTKLPYVLAKSAFIVLFKKTENLLSRKLEAYSDSMPEDDDDIPSEVLEKLPEAYEEVSSQMDGKDVLL